MKKLPPQYIKIGKKFKKYHDALSNLGKAAKDAGPLDEKTSQL